MELLRKTDSNNNLIQPNYRNPETISYEKIAAVLAKQLQSARYKVNHAEDLRFVNESILVNVDNAHLRVMDAVNKNEYFCFLNSLDEILVEVFKSNTVHSPSLIKSFEILNELGINLSNYVLEMVTQEVSKNPLLTSPHNLDGTFDEISYRTYVPVWFKHCFQPTKIKAYIVGQLKELDMTPEILNLDEFEQLLEVILNFPTLSPSQNSQTATKNNHRVRLHNLRHSSNNDATVEYTPYQSLPGTIRTKDHYRTRFNPLVSLINTALTVTQYLNNKRRKHEVKKAQVRARKPHYIEFNQKLSFRKRKSRFNSDHLLPGYEKSRTKGKIIKSTLLTAAIITGLYYADSSELNSKTEASAGKRMAQNDQIISLNEIKSPEILQTDEFTLTYNYEIQGVFDGNIPFDFIESLPRPSEYPGIIDFQSLRVAQTGKTQIIISFSSKPRDTGNTEFLKAVCEGSGKNSAQISLLIGALNMYNQNPKDYYSFIYLLQAVAAFNPTLFNDDPQKESIPANLKTKLGLETAKQVTLIEGIEILLSDTELNLQQIYERVILAYAKDTTTAKTLSILSDSPIIPDVDEF